MGYGLWEVKMGELLVIICLTSFLYSAIVETLFIPSGIGKRIWKILRKPHISFSYILLVALAVAVPLSNYGGSSALAQGFPRLANLFSPLSYMPEFHGELQQRLMVMSIASGENTIPSLRKSWDLRDDFGMVEPSLFLDWMGRIQAGRLSVRLNARLWDFSGTNKFRDLPNESSADARFEYSGLGVGTDFDFFQWGNSRVGVNLDYIMYSPVFTEAIQTQNTPIGGAVAHGKKISGKPPLTFGAHATLIADRRLYGISGVLEVRASWPLLGSSVTDWEISAGFKAPETVLGSIAFKAGYRRIAVEFEDTQLFDNAEVASRLDVVMDGWFGELAYYY